VLAHLVREKGAADQAGDDVDVGDDDEEEGRNIVRALIGSRMLRRRRVRRLLLAHLLKERGASEEGDDEGDVGEGDDDEDRSLMRLVIGSKILRRRRARRMLLAHLARERAAAGEEEEFEEGEGEGDDDFGEGGGGDDNRIMKLLIGSRILRRKRARRMILAHLLKERAESAA
jgi:hypothetical protein